MDPSQRDTGKLVEPRRSTRRRFGALAIVAVVLIGGALLYRHFWFSRPMGMGPAGPIVSREPFQRIWTKCKVLLVGIGDSVTAGYGAPSKHGYFDRLVANPPNEFPDMQGLCLSKVLPNLKAKNVALSGSTSSECLELLVPKLEVQDAETFGIVVMTTGGNDIIHNYGRTPPREGAMYGATLEQAQPWIDNFAVRLETILARIEDKFPGGCEFFIANVYDPTDGVGDAFNAGLPAWPEALQVMDAYNTVIAQVAEKRSNTRLVNMRGAFLGHGIHCLQFWREHYHADDPHYWYWDNLEDPNDRGYDALRRVFLIEMARTLPPILRSTP